MKQTQYKLSDDVLRRIVQLLQEALLTGTDVGDHLRMIRLMELNSDLDGSTLTLDLSPEYSKQVQDNFAKMVKEAEEIQRNRALHGSVIDDPSKLD
jgi:hypothetical protein